MANVLHYEIQAAKLFRFACLGALGFLMASIGAFFCLGMKTHYLPLDDVTKVISTMNIYQYPERVAVVVAVLLPLLYELYRSRRLSSQSIATPQQ
jgi:hypothetical protein